MLLNGSLLGTLFGGIGSTQTQQNTQTNTNTNTNATNTANTTTEEPTSNTVTETADVADSGGTKFDFSSAVNTTVNTAANTTVGTATGVTGNTVGTAVGAVTGSSTDSGTSGTSATQSQGDDDNTLSAYFYAAKWAKSIQTEVAQEVPADADAGKAVSFATEPYRHDVMSQYFSEQTVHFGGKKLATIGANGVLTLADASQATNNPYQAQTSFGSF